MVNCSFYDGIVPLSPLSDSLSPLSSRALPGLLLHRPLPRPPPLSDGLWCIRAPSLPTEELSPGGGLDLEAESRVRRKASDDKEHLVVVYLQSESIGEVAAMVIPCIERKPEGWGAGDEFEVVSDVVQN